MLAMIQSVCFPPTAVDHEVRPPPTTQQQLIHAVVQDQVVEVRTLLAQGGDPNARSEYAVEDKWMLYNQPGSDPSPPLIVLACHFMSIKGPDIIQMLLDKGANVNIADKNGVTPLMAASQLGGAVSLLLDHKADANAVDKADATPLMYAMNNPGENTAAQLLAHGAKINARNIGGKTALMLAITNARHDPIRLYGEDLNKKAETETASYHELIRFLIDSHSDIRARDKSGNTPLSLARAGTDKEVIKMLRWGAKQ